MWQVVSIPMKSRSCSGPMGWPQPSRIPSSTSSFVATPCSTRRTASSRYGTSSTFTTKPARSFATMGRLPSGSAKPRVAATTSGAHWIVSTTSTSRMTGTGLKKCRPTTRSGRRVAAASSTIGMDEVLLARIAAGPQARSSAANSSFLSRGSSVAASTTRSQPPRSSTAVVKRRRASAASRSAAASFPFSTATPRLRSRRALPRATASPSISRTVVAYPARIATSAIPLPMRPQPTTPILSKAIRVSSRSPGRASDVLARVDPDHLAGDHPGGVGQEEQHRRGDVLDLGELLEERLVERLLPELGGEGERHLGEHHARRDGVHGDALRPELAGRGLREADEARLRGGVVRLAELAAQAVDRDDVHDASVARGDHPRRDRPQDVERAGEVHVDDRVPLLVAHLHEALVAGDARVVHEQDRRRGERGHHGGDRLPVRDVHRVEAEAVARRTGLAVEDVDVGA